MESVRLRLVFEEPRMLHMSQRKTGLNQSWILLNPQHKTISDFSSDLILSFRLHDACPNGLILSMDEFVLPPFESILGLKDKDIIRVKRRGGKLSDTVKVGGNGLNTVELEEIVEKEPDVKLLENDQCEEDTGYGLDRLENTPHGGNTTERKTVNKKRKMPEILHSSKRKKHKSPKSNNGAEGLGQLPENSKRVDISDTLGGNKKLPSRNARRKKANRQWLRELQEKAKVEKEEKEQPAVGKSKPQSSINVNLKRSEELPVDCTADEEEDFPVEIRPGHIRFLSRGKVFAHPAVQQSRNTVKTSKCNGLASKKKRGKKKTSSWIPGKGPINFDKLKPYTTLPEKGDVIAYRLIELSSDFTPKLSSFRVGKILWYNAKFNKVTLIPFPKYSIAKSETEKASASQPVKSLYGENGFLKIDHSSLIDLRIVKKAKSNSPSANQICILGFEHRDNKGKNHAAAQENGGVNLWDKLSQLSQEDKWNGEGSLGWRSWSSSKACPSQGKIVALENGRVTEWDKTSQATKKSPTTRENEWSGKGSPGLREWSSCKAHLRPNTPGPSMGLGNEIVAAWDKNNLCTKKAQLTSGNGWNKGGSEWGKWSSSKDFPRPSTSGTTVALEDGTVNSWGAISQSLSTEKSQKENGCNREGSSGWGEWPTCKVCSSPKTQGTSLKMVLENRRVDSWGEIRQSSSTKYAHLEYGWNREGSCGLVCNNSGPTVALQTETAHNGWEERASQSFKKPNPSQEDGWNAEGSSGQRP